MDNYRDQEKAHKTLSHKNSVQVTPVTGHPGRVLLDKKMYVPWLPKIAHKSDPWTPGQETPRPTERSPAKKMHVYHSK